MQPLRTISIIQARMTSSRLPGKVLLDIAGRPMLAWVVERARQAKAVDQVVVATTRDPADDAVEEFCQELGYPTVRGSSQDVLDRIYQAARAFDAQVIVRLTADCPLIDPGLIDETIQAVKEDGYDFVANRLPPPWKRTYPIGLDVEVCTLQALERAWKEASQPHQREHVMPFLYENEPAVDSLTHRVIDLGVDPTNRRGFKVLLLNHDPDYGALRWTVDTPEDLELLRQVLPRLRGRDDFSWYDVLALFEREPELARINAGVVHKGFRDVDQRSVKRET